MALWGNKDSIESAGIVTVRFYDQSWHGGFRTERVGLNTFVGITTAEVIGAATSFGATANCQIGDIIEFGDYSAGTWEGSAVIIGIASVHHLTIGSTSGLSGAAISGLAYHINQSPKYTIEDPSFSARNEAAAGISTLGFVGLANTAVGIGSSAFGIGNLAGITETELKVGDLLINNSNTYTLSNVGNAEVSALAAVGIGSTTIRTNIPPGLSTSSDYLVQGGSAYKVTGIGETQAKVGTA